jgi:hypothetical protein
MDSFILCLLSFGKHELIPELAAIRGRVSWRDMSESGQKAKCSPGADVFRFGPKTDEVDGSRSRHLGAKV